MIFTICTSLCQPGEFFDHTKEDAVADPASYITCLKSGVALGHPCLETDSEKFNVSDNLSTCIHVCIQHDAVRIPLQQLYQSPYISTKMCP